MLPKRRNPLFILASVHDYGYDLRVLYPKHCNIPEIMQYCMERGLNVLVMACLCMLVPLM